MQIRAFHRLVPIAGIAAGMAPAPCAEGSGVTDQLETTLLPLLEERCFECHDDAVGKGDVSFEFLYEPGEARHDLRLWSKVREQMRAGTMPPESKDPLAEAERETVLAWIAANEEHVLESVPPRPGPPRTRRLNREEYNNSLRDLLGIEGRPGDKFPADGAGGEGFANTADTLLLSPLLVEKYLEAADEALAEVWSRDDLRERLAGAGSGDAGDPPEVRAERVLKPFLRRAYRRPVTDAGDVRPLVEVVRGALADGAAWDDALVRAFKAALVSPKFLFLEDGVGEGSAGTDGVQALDGHVLASRLSYLLWSSIPDDELLALADEGRLSDPEELARQARRMLADGKALAFTRSFAGQWLGFDEVFNSMEPDRGKFREFDENLRTAMYEEAIAFSDHLLRGDGSVLDFLDSDYTFLNEPLANLYGIPGVQGGEFRRVALTDDRRGGLTGMAAVLASTSYPRRTSPVLRGKWILERLLGTPPPPPPPDVGQLPEDDRAIGEQTLRGRLEAHRNKPACVGCHVRLDPPGFALENFDPIGKWREDENGKPVDASGEMPGGRPFSTPAEFRSLLMEDKNLFIRSLTTRLLGYALGRGLERSDQPTILRLERTLRENDFRFEPLLVAVVQSHPFRFRAPEER